MGIYKINILREKNDNDFKKSRVSDPHFFLRIRIRAKIFNADPGGIRGRGLGVKGKNEFFF